ncbi:MAG: hypothetical protein HXY34_11650 [Candidatus Thorarchaeota archaeon]|nr:hypothetical protein [Candidatus Thorarchaeota archaeon]
MYELAVLGNPLIRLEALKRGASGSLAGPAICTALTAARLGIENLISIMSVPNELREAVSKDLDRLGIPEYHIIDSGHMAGPEVTLDLDGCPSEYMASPHSLRIRDIPEETVLSNSILLCPSFQEVDTELVQWIADTSDARLLWHPQLYRVTEDGGFKPSLTTTKARSICALVHVARINLRESEALSHDRDPFIGAELLVHWGADIGIVTMAEKGCIVYDGSDFLVVPAYPVKRATQCGAGDVFLAAFALALDKDYDLRYASAYSSAVASLRLENPSYPHPLREEDIQHRLRVLLPDIEIR